MQFFARSRGATNSGFFSWPNRTVLCARYNLGIDIVRCGEAKVFAIESVQRADIVVAQAHRIGEDRFKHWLNICR